MIRPTSIIPFIPLVPPLWLGFLQRSGSWSKSRLASSPNGCQTSFLDLLFVPFLQQPVAVVSSPWIHECIRNNLRFHPSTWPRDCPLFSSTVAQTKKKTWMDEMFERSQNTNFSRNIAKAILNRIIQPLVANKTSTAPLLSVPSTRPTYDTFLQISEKGIATTQSSCHSNATRHFSKYSTDQC